MTTLILARHGETDWNRNGRIQGHADQPLNERGREQARELAERLAEEEIDAVYTSDLRRAAETAEIIGAMLGVEVTADQDLREIDVGTWSGLTRDELGDRDWDGETRETHSARVLRALRRIVARHPDGRVVVVTHGGSCRRVFEALGEHDRPAPASCEVIRVRGDQLD